MFAGERRGPRRKGLKRNRKPNKDEDKSGKLCMETEYGMAAWELRTPVPVHGGKLKVFITCRNQSTKAEEVKSSCFIA